MNVELTNQKSEIAAAIKVTAIGMDKMVEAMETGYPKLMEYVAQQGKEMTGAPYCCYTNCTEDYSQFDIELGIPVSEAVPAEGEIFMSQTYGGKAIAITHKGAYKDIDAAYGILMDYAKENSLELTGDYYDYYVNDPANTPESELLTQIVFPIK